MDLHDFLARSLELLVMIETIEQRQTAMAANIARLGALPVGDASRAPLLASLLEGHRTASADLDRSIELLADF
jgi:hypothetical protein